MSLLGSGWAKDMTGAVLHHSNVGTVSAQDCAVSPAFPGGCKTNAILSPRKSSLISPSSLTAVAGGSNDSTNGVMEIRGTLLYPTL